MPPNHLTVPIHVFDAAFRVAEHFRWDNEWKDEFEEIRLPNPYGDTMRLVLIPDDIATVAYVMLDTAQQRGLVHTYMITDDAMAVQCTLEQDGVKVADVSAITLPEAIILAVDQAIRHYTKKEYPDADTH